MKAKHNGCVGACGEGTLYLLPRYTEITCAVFQPDVFKKYIKLKDTEPNCGKQTQIVSWQFIPGPPAPRRIGKGVQKWKLRSIIDKQGRPVSMHLNAAGERRLEGIYLHKFCPFYWYGLYQQYSVQ